MSQVRRQTAAWPAQTGVARAAVAAGEDLMLFFGLDLERACQSGTSGSARPSRSARAARSRSSASTMLLFVLEGELGSGEVGNEDERSAESRCRMRCANAAGSSAQWG